MRTFTADLAWVQLGADAPSLAARPEIDVDDGGMIVAIRAASRPGAAVPPAAVPPTPNPQNSPPRRIDTLVHDLGRVLLLPGLVNAHSHAFQRTMRGATHHGLAADTENFWSWRDAMYEQANRLDPEGVYAATRACFAEMLGNGITCVGEFHYLHHGPNGDPYDDPNELSWAIVRAARDVGIRLALLEVYYARAGGDADGPIPPSPNQRRFCDRDVDAYLERVETVRARANGHDWSVGLAPHSVRAVGLDDLRTIARFANANAMPLHAHVSEQRRENEACRAEHGMSPTALFAEAGCMDRPASFTAVHAVHVDDHDLADLAGQTVCACPSTEADLGDGIVPASLHRAAGVSLALGSDSNSVIDLVQEARALEMNERLRTGRRVCLGRERPAVGGAPARVDVAPVLVDAMTIGGAQSLGRPSLGRLAVGSPFDAAVFDLQHDSLADVPDGARLAALVLAGSASACRGVYVNGVQRR